jgi:4-aminobutyrate aminotransferase-like enzyme
LKHPRILSFNASGLLISIEFESFELNKKIIDYCIQRGLFTDWFLFASQCMRIAPPLIISEEQINMACAIILEGCSTVN